MRLLANAYTENCAFGCQRADKLRNQFMPVTQAVYWCVASCTPCNMDTLSEQLHMYQVPSLFSNVGDGFRSRAAPRRTSAVILRSGYTRARVLMQQPCAHVLKLFIIAVNSLLQCWRAERRGCACHILSSKCLPKINNSNIFHFRHLLVLR